MDSLSELNRLSKRAPRHLRNIALYNLINFWFSFVLAFVLSVFYILVLPADQIVLKNMWPMLVFIGIVVFAYAMVHINLKLLLGSNAAYWVLLLFFTLQCFGYQLGSSGVNFEFGAIPLTFRFGLGDGDFIKINIAAIIFTVYLIGIKPELPNMIEKINYEPKRKTSESKLQR
jgi:hypothetical protein